MRCPHCGHDGMLVEDTRAEPDGTTRRRRKCSWCGTVIHTAERRDETPWHTIEKGHHWHRESADSEWVETK